MCGLVEEKKQSSSVIVMTTTYFSRNYEVVFFFSLYLFKIIGTFQCEFIDTVLLFGTWVHQEEISNRCF